MWMGIVFFLGMLGFLIFIILCKLCKFKGTKFKDRLSYALAFSLFLTPLGQEQRITSNQILMEGRHGKILVYADGFAADGPGNIL